MNINKNNFRIVTIAAWTDWHEKAWVFLESAKKQGLNVTVLDKREKWKGYFFHKIEAFRHYLLRLRYEEPDIRYVLYSDCRDAVFVKGFDEIRRACKSFSDEAVVFSAGRTMYSWPLMSRWFAERISLRYGPNGIINTGGFVGKVDRLLELFDEIILFRKQLTGPSEKQTLLQQFIVDSLSDAGGYAPRCLDDDQFLIQCLQASWSDLLDVDIERNLFALFREEFPRIRTAPETLTSLPMPLGKASILHSPWMLPRSDMNEKNISAWEYWARQEGIIETYGE